MLTTEFTNTYGDVGRVEILKIFHPWTLLVFLKEFFEKSNFEKVSRQQWKH